MTLLKYKKIGSLLFFGIFLLLFLEIGSRLFLTLVMGRPFSIGAETVFYPEIINVKKCEIKKDDGYFDILFLGASVLLDEHSNIGRLLSERLAAKTGKNIRVHNVSTSAHSSLDSYYKYRHLQDKNFDLVLFYHGINEVRANNCPPSVFKDDYSHYVWYEVINLFERYKKINFITFPWVSYFIIHEVKEKFHATRYISVYGLRKEWAKYGNDVKTENSFRRNLAGIIEIANKKEEPVLLMTLAYYVPEGYSLERFESKTLDYGSHRYPIEIWGEPEYAAKGILVHNKVIKEIASRYKNTIFIDQDRLIPKNGQYFNDICHFSDKGYEKFVDNIVEVILKNRNLLYSFFLQDN